jgi:cytidylate kinase
MIIAVDGPAAAGKGTIARALARHFGLNFLDTGTLYRMVGLSLLRQNVDASDANAAIAAAEQLDPKSFRESELRGEDVGSAASKVAVNPGVRKALLQFQRDFAATPPGAVLDGRDIGTVVCPDADVKLYITASAEVRARRRRLELQGLGRPSNYEEVLKDILARDERDSRRSDAPLRAAADAIVIDTSTMGIEKAVSVAIVAVESKRPAT